MIRNKPSSAMQKTYDDCYLICSTAVYFESQNNEEEALRSWKNALDQIYYHNAFRVSSQYQPRSETEKALQGSLKQLELQCKERVDLLEALKQSREDAAGDKEQSMTAKPTQAPPIPPKVPPHGSTSYTGRKSNEETPGWLGGGTIPSVNYPDLSRPALPKRPSLGKTSSDKTAARSSSYSKAVEASSSSNLAPAQSSPRVSRTPSPEKRGKMLRTLRPGRDGTRPAPKLASTMRSNNKAPVAAGRAAGLAWGAPSPSLTPSVPMETGAAASAYTSRLSSSRVSGERPRPSDSNTHVRSSRPLSASELPSQQQTSARDEHLKYRLTRDQQVDMGINVAKGPPRNTLQASIPPTATQSAHSTGSNMPSSPAKSSTNGTRPLAYRKEYLPQPVRTEPQTSSDSSQRADDSSIPSSSSPRPRRKAVPVSKLNRANVDDTLAKARKAEKKPLYEDELDPVDSANSSLEGLNIDDDEETAASRWKAECDRILKNLPRGVDEGAAKQILNEIVIQGDEVHWEDVAGLDIAKNALKETVVYPFLRPDLFMGLREPARGMLLFGPPGTGKTMLARAVATESRSTFFAISASSLTSKFLGESEKLVRALFSLAKVMAPSIIFVDEIDSLLSSRSGNSEHEATRRIKTEFLIQWSDLAKAAAGREQSDKEKEKGDASRVLVLAATNLPWDIDEAARRRFVRRQYIPLPEGPVRRSQLETLLSHQNHDLSAEDLDELVQLTDSFSGSDITALAKDAAMGPLRSLGEKLLSMKMDEIRPIQVQDFKASLTTIRPSVSKQGLKEFEDWAREFGERGG